MWNGSGHHRRLRKLQNEFPYSWKRRNRTLQVLELLYACHQLDLCTKLTMLSFWSHNHWNICNLEIPHLLGNSSPFLLVCWCLAFILSSTCMKYNHLLRNSELDVPFPYFFGRWKETYPDMYQTPSHLTHSYQGQYKCIELSNSSIMYRQAQCHTI